MIGRFPGGVAAAFPPTSIATVVIMGMGLF